MISEAHKNRLLLHYGIDPDRPEIKAMEETGCSGVLPPRKLRIYQDGR